MRNLLLTGFMGTGKTTVGSIVGRRFGLRFVDMDVEVERRAGATIPQIFASRGESEFRRLETRVLQDLLCGEGQIIATGGGALVSPDNVSLLARDDVAVSLTCAPDELAQRIADPGLRPLADGHSWDELMQLLESRRSAYERFVCVDTTGRSPEDITDDIGQRLDLQQAGRLTFETTHDSILLFAEGLLDRLGAIFRNHGLSGDVVLVSDDTVVSLGIQDRAATSLQAEGFCVHPAIIPTGEQHKNLDALRDLYGLCLARHIDRQTVVVGLGGGVIGDIAGMLAATYLRGLRLVLVPTTLLAQVDASIGGKVGVDLMGAKNLVGAFYPAALVVIDPSTLQTLPEPRLADGLAEIMKIALVRSIGLLHQLEELRAPGDILHCPQISRRAALEKLKVVERDPFERGKDRAMLNFGHTIGHAVEAASGYRLSHGQAVSVGMAAETWLAESLGLCAPGVLSTLLTLLDRFGLPSAASGLDPGRVWEFLLQDKKRVSGQIRLALPTEPGAGDLHPIEASDVKLAVRHALGAA